ncbi:hypothetical protein [Oxalobacter formigenes]|uniref:hypothetical protein n=1 Tax=Oxalobacter formigenes TaxID=847 RepID=UPI0011DC9F1C|nr:hypothetical protein [Oxalobacter formigenes]WAW07109.1 hypothetical protein NB638_06080 [Oxalobacter formigenes]
MRSSIDQQSRPVRDIHFLPILSPAKTQRSTVSLENQTPGPFQVDLYALFAVCMHDGAAAGSHCSLPPNFEARIKTHSIWWKSRYCLKTFAPFTYSRHMNTPQ